MNVAVCLFVRDEVHDIASWLAWYHLLGFDACIVYDDNSSDGTWEVLCSAAQVQDVRLLRSLGNANAYHTRRQDACYLDAIGRYREEFEWIGFFDVDEYLRLYNSHSIQEFLARFPDAGSIGINWCCYGSSGHCFRPAVTPIEAYTWHSTTDLPINRHVKTLLHLPSWQGGYINVHHFDVAPKKALGANGEVIHWSQTVGITQTPPDWRVAKVMHYQCRSMEDFLERLRKIPSLSRDARLWATYDVADEEDKSPLVFAPALHEQIDRYTTTTSAIKRPLRRQANNPQLAYPALMQQSSKHVAPMECKPTFQGLVMDLGVGEGNDTAYYLAKGFQVVAVEADPQMCRLLRQRFRSQIESGTLVLLNFVASASFGECVEFFVHNQHQGISSVYKRGDVDPAGYSAHSVSTIDWRTLIAQAGLPRYLKVDIERHEEKFLSGMTETQQIPEFVSVEAYKFRPCEMLYEMGYERFKLVDQNPLGGFKLPTHQMEGLALKSADFAHGSGPFGLDLFGDGAWLDFDALRVAWSACEPQMANTWFDCHAWRPN